MGSKFEGSTVHDAWNVLETDGVGAAFGLCRLCINRQWHSAHPKIQKEDN